MEKRLGKTGVWEFVMKTNEGHILAQSEWGTVYVFHEAEWNAIPVIEGQANGLDARSSKHFQR